MDHVIDISLSLSILFQLISTSFLSSHPPCFLRLSRPRLVLMNPVKNLTCCDIPWSNASVSCLKTTLAAAASWKSCPCCPHRPSAPDPASSPHRTSTAPWLNPPHSQVTGQKTQWWLLIAHLLWWFTLWYPSIIPLFLIKVNPLLVYFYQLFVSNQLSFTEIQIAS